MTLAPGMKLFVRGSHNAKLRDNSFGAVPFGNPG